MSAYYNEHDPFAAAWLRELIRDGLIADGFVDDRSITDVQPDDLAGLTQCHFFAGIGGWSYALRLAGWPDDRPIWTGSCPCQPFSAAGKRQGGSDDRHLWPQWARLIRECRPGVLAGEQVASAVGHGWLDLVSTDLEAEGYAVGAVVLGAHSVGAPHLRQRLWFVADHDRAGRQEQRERGLLDGERSASRHDADGRGADGDMGHANEPGSQGRRERRDGARKRAARTASVGDELADAERRERRQIRADADWSRSRSGAEVVEQRFTRSSAWADLVWLPCRDGKARPTQPGLQPLAHGVPARVGRLRGYGNAIVPQVAAEVIRAYMEIAC